jgi:uncharacterized peroxidase-related enzyme
MSRIASPAAITDAPPSSQPLLQELARKTGRVANAFRIMANSPSALQGFMALNNALAQGSLSEATRQRISLAVTEVNGCDYCLSAQIFFGRQASLDDAELTANRNGASNDMREDAAVRFAAKIVRTRGHVSDEDVAAFKAAGYSEAELVELVAQVALRSFTNYLNEVAGTEIDFPIVNHRAAYSKAARDAA